ncbi:ABC transporter substrate-binding protein [Vibrio sp. YMD68]|uniref:ABC transporter substrate-binding protein n=1 Tax=Vibrio sp. YMD68 TaxID=3042300 RepID=UPI00249CAE49|nr:ABC transporter substrate-binding protein [Vibrio sp. YMD68]WGW01691.1 ABC transporter substrate-binding protein [Vibrio sp. YMD68]
MTEISYASISRKKKLKRGLMFATLAIAVIFAATTLVSEKPTEPVTPNKTNTLSISGPWEISSLDPSKKGYILTRMQVIETLLNVDEQGVITPGLATQWSSSEDGLIWRFILREGVVFHDGMELDAQAVVTALLHAKSKHGTLNKAQVINISAVKGNEIQIELAKPYTAFASLLTNYSTVILSPKSYNPDGTVEVLYGTGPYQMESFSPPHQLTVKKFDAYWGEKAQIHFATYLTGHRAESRILQAKSGEADIVFTLDPSMLAQIKDSNEVTLHRNLIPRTMFVKVNASHPFLNDVAARQALSIALNRAAITKNVLDAEGSETAQLMPSSMSQWFLQGVDNNPYDLEKSQNLLSGLGWKRNQSGVLEREGKPFKLTMITYADRPELTVVATAIQAQWAKLGVELKVDVTNSSMIPAGHTDGSLEMALIARNFGFIADPLPIISTDFSNGGGDWGTMNWSNPIVDSAIAKLVESNHPGRSFDLSQTVAKEIYQDTPVIPISSYTQHTSVNNRVMNFKFDPFERNYFINQMSFEQTVNQ